MENMTKITIMTIMDKITGMVTVTAMCMGMDMAIMVIVMKI
jgi:hypothetical protein